MHAKLHSRTRWRRFCAASVAAGILILAALTADGRAQTHSGTAGSGTPLSFEVATIKPVDPHGMVGPEVEVKPGGMVYLYGVPLKQMICTAYHLAWWPVEGGEPWIEKDLYNVVAKAPATGGKPYDLRHSLFGIEDPRLRAMLQTLLAERFALKVHEETKTGRVYLLELSGKPLQLKAAAKAKPVRQDDGPDAEPEPVQDAGAFSSIGWAGGSWGIFDITMPQLAKFAGDFYVHRPILDRTGLTGAFDYRSAPEDNTAFWQDQTGSFLRMLGDAGLKLTPAEGPVETLVIDHAEAPTPN